MSSVIAAGVVVAAGTIYAADKSASAAKSAAQTQANAANSANQTQYSMFQQEQANAQPYMTAGNAALTQLQQTLQRGFNPGQYQQSPGYQFQVQQGEQAINSNMAAKGLLASGAGATALQQFGTGLANQDYNQWLTNAQNMYQTQVGNLQNLSQQGLSAATGINQQGGNTAAIMGQNTIGAANAQAAGTVGAANAMQSGVNSLGNQYMMSQYMQGQNPSTYGGGLARSPVSYAPTQTFSYQPTSYAPMDSYTPPAIGNV